MTDTEYPRRMLWGGDTIRLRPVPQGLDDCVPLDLIHPDDLRVFRALMRASDSRAALLAIRYIVGGRA